MYRIFAVIFVLILSTCGWSVSEEQLKKLEEKLNKIEKITNSVRANPISATANYPTAYADSAGSAGTWPLIVSGDLVKPIWANRAHNEIVAIERELGTNPSGSYDTVSARFDAIEASFGSGSSPTFVVGSGTDTHQTDIYSISFGSSNTESVDAEIPSITVGGSEVGSPFYFNKDVNISGALTVDSLESNGISSSANITIGLNGIFSNNGAVNSDYLNFKTLYDSNSSSGIVGVDKYAKIRNKIAALTGIQQIEFSFDSSNPNFTFTSNGDFTAVGNVVGQRIAPTKAVKIPVLLTLPEDGADGDMVVHSQTGTYTLKIYSNGNWDTIKELSGK